jgi:hypothetical protein
MAEEAEAVEEAEAIEAGGDGRAPENSVTLQEMFR